MHRNFRQILFSKVFLFQEAIVQGILINFCEGKVYLAREAKTFFVLSNN